ncbi:MAG: lipopolysaccharide biosynthesis protein [Desulfovibrio sp.]|jgi:O-antigen/teichoic acid export membrane protein|nr:lipopolysaccharide biosynthesis protein [Desulfovibrio sp.]
MSATDSLAGRYLYKLAANISSVPLFLVMEAVLPRALGPAAYGNYNFAVSLFQNFTNFFDLGTSTCLTTSLAKRPREFGLAVFYARVAAAVPMFGLVIAGCCYLPGAGDLLMPGVPLWLVFPAMLWAWLTWVGRVARGMNDALGLTAASERVRMAGSALSACLLVGLYCGGVLDLPVLFAQQYLVLLLAAAGYLYTMRGSWERPLRWTLGGGEVRSYAREFRVYCSPLFVTALCSVLALSGERWILQFFAGSVEQGYFSLSQKIGAACVLFVTALTPLLARELAVAHGKGDAAGMARILDRYAPMLYTMSAWISCFVVLEAPAVLRIFGGDGFAGALAPVRIMALYPIHQGYGQAAAAIFYASGNTRSLRNISLGVLALGPVLTWLLTAPGDMGGLGMGASGLALKMVGLQFLSVNLLFLAARRSVPFALGRNVLHQFACPAVFLAAGAASGFAVSGLGGEDDLFRFAASGALYVALTLGAGALVPGIFGLTRADLLRALRLTTGRGTE